MTAKEYLNQARHLDALINCRLREIDYWRDLSSSVSGSNFEPHYNPNKPTEAPFVRCLEKIDAIQSEDGSIVPPGSISRCTTVSPSTTQRTV